jgi:inner membrane protein
MKWINHTIIAGSITAVINPLAVPSAIIGGIAPDLLEKLIVFCGSVGRLFFLLI